MAGRILVPRGERARVQLAAMASGALAAAGAFGLVRWWVAERASVGSAELGLVMLLGALPAMLLGVELHNRLRRRDDSLPAATARGAADRVGGQICHADRSATRQPRETSDV